MSLTLRRSTVVVLFGAAVFLAAAASDAGAEPPLRVHFRADVDLAQNGSLSIRGVFRPDGARVLVESDELPPPESGSYDVVLSAGDANLLDIVLSEAPDGGFQALDDVAGDQRLAALGLDRVTLFDGDEIVAAVDDVEISAHVRFRGDLRFESGGRSRHVAVAGRAGRRFDGAASHTIKIVTGLLEPGEYVVRLEGDDGALIVIPFAVDAPRLRRHITVKEPVDRLDEMARLHTAVLTKDGSPIAVAPLGPIR